MMMTTQPETTSNTPTHTIYVVETREGNAKSTWLPIGAAWEHNGGEGLNLSINSLGISYLKDKGQDANLVIRRNKPKE
ncbi:hypothetical protein GO755_20415 [Spirosoma sp. HMF4905]|uniref:Uncharacterized protein n=1 Tax=Spirosoma arboris TaxID=2682092 RepID=A0A7K1SF39_9BACT|nr:hypothetical protein [Spirosoma arboris]MVM32422.1 hypothetical protein [Spirosoma arboris]